MVYKVTVLTIEGEGIGHVYVNSALIDVLAYSVCSCACLHMLNMLSLTVIRQPAADKYKACSREREILDEDDELHLSDAGTANITEHEDSHSGDRVQEVDRDKMKENTPCLANHSKPPVAGKRDTVNRGRKVNHYV